MTNLTVDPAELRPGDLVLGLAGHEEDGCHCDVRVTVGRAGSDQEAGGRMRSTEDIERDLEHESRSYQDLTRECEDARDRYRRLVKQRADARLSAGALRDELARARQEQDDRANDAAVFCSASREGDGTRALPCIEIGGVQVYAYAENGTLIISAHFDTADGRVFGLYGPDKCVPVVIKAGSEEPVWQALPGDDDEDRRARLAMRQSVRREALGIMKASAAAREETWNRVRLEDVEALLDARPESRKEKKERKS